MTPDAKTLKLCNCNKSMSLDGRGLGEALGCGEALRVHSELCRREIGEFEAALSSGGPVFVGCTQESTLFREVAEERGATVPVNFFNIREFAGWGAGAGSAQAKIAALAAAAALPEPEPVPGVGYRSGGQLLIIGQGAVALEWAERLAERLDVAVLIASDSGRGEMPAERRYPVWSGKVASVKGWLGAFDVAWEQSNPIDLEACTRCNACVRACPEQAIDFSYQIDLDRCRDHRACVKACQVGAIDFKRADRARSERFDLVLDLCAEPLIRLHQPPQGYLAPGRDPLDQALAIAKLAELVGEFEKPKFFNYKASICAHSRNRVSGCSRCIDVCSTGAIAPDGDHVRVEPHLCMGCGACATVCPSGAMSYAYPAVPWLGEKVRTLLSTYRKAGGRDACLLFHNGEDGRALLMDLGRRGEGLPARVIPVEVLHVASLGLDLMLSAVALGASQVAVLAAGSEAPEYIQALERQMGFGAEILDGLGYGAGHLRLVQAADRAGLEAALWGLAPARTLPVASFKPLAEKRRTLDLAFDHLGRHAPAPRVEIALSAGAPFGAVAVDKDKCTLCMSCVGACPENALLASPDAPRLRFVERNCVQCGLCQKTCPEAAIQLVPRLDLRPEARSERLLNEDEPAVCTVCGKPYGTRRMIDLMVRRLGNHSMFAEPGSINRMRMCGDCRVSDLVANEQSVSIFDLPQ